MNIYALQTARGGSKSVPNKNIKNVKGIPLYLHNILHAKKSNFIKGVYVSTDIDFIKDHSEIYNYNTIDRPVELTGDHASHYDTILHGLDAIENEIGNKIDILVVLLGNSIGAFSSDLDSAIELLLKNDKVDSVQSVSEYSMYNPFRALNINSGYLETVLPQDYISEQSKLENINDRNAAGKVYFFNGSFWVIRRDSLIKKDGILPFPWLGKKILPYIQENYMEVDAQWQLNYLEKIEWDGI